MKKLKTLATVVACLAGLSFSVPVKAYESNPDWERRKYYSDVAIGDVYGDNKPDIVYISTNQSYYDDIYPPYYVMVKENLGDGKFKIHKLDLVIPEIEFEDDTYIHLNDMNCDGLNDIVLKSGHHLLIFKNHGNLKFSRWHSETEPSITEPSKKNNLESKVGKDKPDETKCDPAVENGYTHIKRTWSLVRETPVTETLDYQSALEKVLDEMRGFRHILDKTEHLQYPEETQKLKTGDCEDYTMYFLWKMKQYGVPIESLGICILAYPGEDQLNHIVPIVKDGSKWMFMQSLTPGTALGDLEKYIYINQLRDYSYDLTIFTIQGLHEGGEVVIEEHSSEEKMPLKEFQQKTEEALIKKGYATE